MHNDIKISVIIPMYNAAYTVEKCIKSVLEQTIDGLEIICVDDGSEDNTIDMVKKLSKQYLQIRLICQNHQGSGLARNIGIEESKGEFVAFLDADDILWDRNALAYMIECSTKNNAEICGSYRKINEDGEISDSELLRQFEIPSMGRFIDFTDFQYDYDYQSFIFKRKFLIKNKITFPLYMRYQDPPFFLDAMICAQRFYAVPVILYCYTINSLSGTLVCRYIAHVLTGILDNLQKSRDYGYHKLFEETIRRVEQQYYESILAGLNTETMKLLLDINDIYQSECQKELNILQDIWNMKAKKDNLEKSHELLKWILDIKQNMGGFRNFFDKRRIKRVVVYGLGAYGKILIGELEECGIEIAGCIDQKGQCYKKYIAGRPDEMIPECDAVIVSLMEPEEIVKGLEKKTEIPVYNFPQIIYEIINSRI